MDSQGMKGFYSMKKSRVGRDAGKRSQHLAPGWNQQLRDLPYKHFGTGLWYTKGSQCGEGPYVGPASLLESLGVPCWVYFFLIQEA